MVAALHHHHAAEEHTRWRWRLILAGAPLPQRIVVQLFGARAAAGYRMQVHGIPN